MSAADLMRKGQRMHAANFPAIVRIGGQTYECSTSGLMRGFDLGEGLGHPSRKVCFWLQSDAFEKAGQPVPREESDIEARPALPGQAAWVTYLLKNVMIDAPGATIKLDCEARAS